MKDYRESIIHLDHDAKTAEVWTYQPGLAARLKRMGFVEVRKQSFGTWWRGSIKQVSFRKLRSKPGVQPRQGQFQRKQQATTGGV